MFYVQGVWLKAQGAKAIASCQGIAIALALTGCSMMQTADEDRLTLEFTVEPRPEGGCYIYWKGADETRTDQHSREVSK